MYGFKNTYCTTKHAAILAVLLLLFVGCVSSEDSQPAVKDIDCGSQTWTIRVHDGVDIDKLVIEYQSIVVWRSDLNSTLYAIQRPCISKEDLKTDPLARDKRVVSLEHQVARQRYKKQEQ